MSKSKRRTHESWGKPRTQLGKNGDRGEVAGPAWECVNNPPFSQRWEEKGGVPSREKKWTQDTPHTSCFSKKCNSLKNFQSLLYYLPQAMIL